MEINVQDINARNKHLRLDINLDENDIEEAFEIAQMMQSNAWKRLEAHIVSVHDQIVDNGKNTVKYKDRLDMSQICWSVLEGFDVCATIAKAIVDRANEFNRRKREDEGGGDSE